MRAAGERPDPVGPLGMAGTRSDDDKGDPLIKRATAAGLGRKSEAADAVAARDSTPNAWLAGDRVRRKDYGPTGVAGRIRAIGDMPGPYRGWPLVRFDDGSESIINPLHLERAGVGGPPECPPARVSEGERAHLAELQKLAAETTAELASPNFAPSVDDPDWWKKCVNEIVERMRARVTRKTQVEQTADALPEGVGGPPDSGSDRKEGAPVSPPLSAPSSCADGGASGDQSTLSQTGGQNCKEADEKAESLQPASPYVEIMGSCATCGHLWESHTDDAGCAARPFEDSERCPCPGHSPRLKRAAPSSSVDKWRCSQCGGYGPSVADIRHADRCPERPSSNIGSCKECGRVVGVLDDGTPTTDALGRCTDCVERACPHGRREEDQCGVARCPRHGRMP